LQGKTLNAADVLNLSEPICGCLGEGRQEHFEDFKEDQGVLFYALSTQYTRVCTGK